MRLRITTILAAVPLLVMQAMGASLHYEVAGIAIPEPATLALLGAAMLGFIKLLRKKLRS